MKILKNILIALVLIIAIVLIAALILPSAYHVERTVTINAPSDSVFNYVKFLKNQDNFSVWNKLDPFMKKDFHGTDGQPGAVAAWASDSAEVGKGEQEIIKITEGQRVDTELRFFEPFESTDMAYFNMEAIDSSTTKTAWGFDGKMPYPMNLMLLTMNMDELLGKDLEQGLQNLKVILEH